MEPGEQPSVEETVVVPLARENTFHSSGDEDTDDEQAALEEPSPSPRVLTKKRAAADAATGTDGEAPGAGDGGGSITAEIGTTADVRVGADAGAGEGARDGAEDRAGEHGGADSPGLAAVSDPGSPQGRAVDSGAGGGGSEAHSKRAAEEQALAALPEKNVVVHVKLADGSVKDVPVLIVPCRSRKAFLGGFRNKKTSVEYHNATSQTPRILRPRSKELYHRQTQTVQTSSGTTNWQQTARTASTQMTKPGCFVSSIYDHEVHARPYMTAEEQHAFRVKKIILLQSYWRRWLAQRFVAGLRAQRKKFMDWKQLEIERKLKMDQEEKARTLHRRIHPSQKQDFDMLLSGLQTWKHEQGKLITSLPLAQQPRARQDLQQQETRYLTSIERLRHIARQQNKESAVQTFFEQVCEPQRWVDPVYGKTNTMQTLDIQRAAELRQLYTSLQHTDVAKDERVAVLASVRTCVKEHDTKLSRDIVELLDREEELLKRGVRDENLEGLRKRALNLFLLFCETPQYNPQAARVVKVHKNFSADVRLCSGCGRFLSIKAFDAAPATHTLSRCRQCAHVHNVALGRKDPTPFERILRELQADEARREEASRLCFMVTAEDVRTLVERVWGGRSALSQHAELHHLVLARWDTAQPWAPWNTVLLTAEEAAAHAKLPSLEGAYAEALRARVQHRAIQARVLFRRLAEQEQDDGLAG